jgi:L-ascorbate 6-phosphate lactonase
MGNDINHNKLAVKGFMNNVKAIRVEKNTLAIFWLGQAGFLIKTPKGSLIAIDPYLSDYCEQLVGFKRIMLPVLCPDEFNADYLFVSHEHPDHFDVDLIRQLKQRESLKIFGPDECEKIAMKNGIYLDNFILLEENKPVDLGECILLPVKADHGEQSPKALGFIFDFGFIKVYFAGDTAYSPDKLKRVYESKPEIALLPINGEYGNLNSEEAARLAKEIGAKVVIPCHYWTFIEHGSYPLHLKKIMEEEMPEIKLVFLAQGECYTYDGMNNR